MPWDLVEPAIALRAVIAETRDPSLRARIREIETDLRARIGPTLPKRVAARALGVSVTALDRWIDHGVLPVVATPGSTRLAVEAAPLLELATRVRGLRERGSTRGVVAEAVRSLGGRRRTGRVVYSHEVASLPRPDETLDELQSYYRRTTPEGRLCDLIALNASLALLTGGASR